MGPGSLTLVAHSTSDSPFDSERFHYTQADESLRGVPITHRELPDFSSDSGSMHMIELEEVEPDQVPIIHDLLCEQGLEAHICVFGKPDDQLEIDSIVHYDTIRTTRFQSHPIFGPTSTATRNTLSALSTFPECRRLMTSIEKNAEETIVYGQILLSSILAVDREQVRRALHTLNIPIDPSTIREM